MLTAVVGLNWGDEGKGRMVDHLAGAADVVVRYHGGANAGHTVHTDAGTFTLHSLPSGALRADATSVLGPGMAVDLDGFLDEVAEMVALGTPADRLLLSDRASVCLPLHGWLDGAEEERLGASRYGSTRKGIAPAYGDRALKKTLLVGELFAERSLRKRIEQVVDWANERIVRIYGGDPLAVREVEEWADALRPRLRPHVVDATELLSGALADGAHVLAEGQLGALRDLYFGIYPYTTSSICLAGHAPVGMGVPWASIDRVVGVTKAYSSCVGAGPFVTEFDEPTAERLRRRWGEYGATTSRPRRLGDFDAVATSYGARLQGATEIALTNLDQLSGLESLRICEAYRIDGVVTSRFPTLPERLEDAQPAHQSLEGWEEDVSEARSFAELPGPAQRYVEAVEAALGVPVRFVSVGSHRDALIDRAASPAPA